MSARTRKPPTTHIQPEPPAHLSESAQQAWRELTRDASAINAIEAPALEAYANAIARMRDARERIDREGMLIQDAKGNPISHPALPIERAAAAEVKSWVERYRGKIARL